MYDNSPLSKDLNFSL